LISLQLARISEQILLPKYWRAPATLLAGSQSINRQEGTRFGRFQLAGAFYCAIRSDISSFVLVVEVKDSSVRRFYGRESFLPFPERPPRM